MKMEDDAKVVPVIMNSLVVEFIGTYENSS